MSSYYNPPQYEYATAPAPPVPHEFTVPHPPASAFSPAGYYDSPTSPLVVSASPSPSVAHSRSSSRHNGEYDVGGRNYLAPNGYSVVPERGRVMVEDSRRRSRTQSRGKMYYEPKKKYYIDDYDDAYSNYSGSSYGGDSREQSRSHSRRRRNHSRTPSRESDDSYDERYGITRYRPSRQEEELTSKLKEVQRQLERVQVDAEKKRLEDEQAKMEKLRNQEIEKKVAEQLIVQKKKEEDKARAEKEALEKEKKRIAEAAKKLLDEQAAAAAAKKAAEAAKKAEIQAIVDQERQKYTAAQSGKKTYTRFSKTHLCKEALEERSIPFTEEAEYFLVHRFVEKHEQQYLWNRTKEIRAYYHQIQEAAEKAPTVAGPNGGYVKYVQIAGQPYPLALPVTITRTPGGGQTQRVDPKIKWSDIFKAK